MSDQEKDEDKFSLPDDFMNAIRGKPQVPQKESFAAPGERTVVDQETGVPLLGRPKLQSWPLGPFNLELPPNPNLDPRALFNHAYSHPTLSVETREMSAAMVAWMASSIAFTQLAAHHNSLLEAFQNLWQDHESLKADHQALLVQLGKAGIIDVHFDESPVEGDPWQEGPDGALYARYGSAIAQIRRVLYVEVGNNGHKAVVDATHGESIEGTQEGYQLLIDGRPVGLFDDIEEAKTFTPEDDEDEEDGEVGADGNADAEETTADDGPQDEDEGDDASDDDDDLEGLDEEGKRAVQKANEVASEAASED